MAIDVLRIVPNDYIKQSKYCGDGSTLLPIMPIPVHSGLLLDFSTYLFLGSVHGANKPQQDLFSAR